MDSDFIKEKIKEKPVNKRKLMMKVILTVVLAILFGTVAAVAYVTMVHYASEKMYPSQPDIVNIPDDVAISDNTASADEALSANEASGNSAQGEEPAQTVINNITKVVQITPAGYEQLYASLHDTAVNAEKSLVNVTGMSSDTDWFANTYENTDQSAGLIIADNGKELLILTDSSIVEGAETISIEFCNGTTAKAETKKSDPNTGLEIVGVPLEAISGNTINEIQMADLGNSASAQLVGSPVIAIGSPLGMYGSEAYGLITSTTKNEQLIDTNAHLITTDIYGSKSASGVIINYSGQVLGLITDSYSADDTANIITTYAISDMKETIEKLANGQDKAYLGIYGTDVTSEAMTELNIPEGAYVTKTDISSPAMNAGIQSGDVITKFGTTEIKDFDDYKEVISKSQPEDETVITVKRYAKGEYTEMTFDVTLGKLK